ncbi:valacyclovir hydrolase isoform X1 [Aplysia californica]|uniref:Valacyclovir hydrolase isoform X1 n=1 Tax=Aplysia californica TaxID=6500 RepID=A0ABM0JUQ4_APLCA|nr:valacyclovir hydrolase isoform X1 [Aplysia californica]
MSHRLRNVFDIVRYKFRSSSVPNFYSTSSSRTSDRVLKSEKIHTNGVDFHYTQAGDGAHCVLLLPGALGSALTDFMPQLKGLDEKKYNIICFDPRGYGRSRPPDRDWPLLYLQRDAYDAAAVMKALDIHRYSVLGWSDGGITGMILAAAFPGNVQRLLIWGSNAYITEDDMKLFKSIDNVDKWSPRMREPFVEVYGQSYFRLQWKAWVNAYGSYFTQRNGDICVGSLPNIKCSTLIVNGIKDPLVPQEHPLFLHKHIPSCRMVNWPEGKHNLHLRYSEEFNTLAEEFLDEELTLQQ